MMLLAARRTTDIEAVNLMFHFPFFQLCFSAEELVLIHGLADNSSTSSGLGRTDLAQLSPALVQQILSGACAEPAGPLTPDGLTTTESTCSERQTETLNPYWKQIRTKEKVPLVCDCRSM